MRFVESTKYEVTHVRMGFYNSNHSDDEHFDGVLRILAHAFSSESDSLHVDMIER